MKLGNLDITNIKLGTNTISRAYLGNNLVYGLDPLTEPFLTANGITDGTYKQALNKMFVDARKEGLLSGIQAWHIYYGDIDSSKFNVMNPIDENRAFRLTFYGSSTVDKQGFQGNGIDTYADTHFIPSIEQTAGNTFALIILGTNNPTISSDTVDFGAFSLGQSYIVAKNNNGTNRRLSRIETSFIMDDYVDDATGIWTTSSQFTFSEFKRNNTVIATGTIDSGEQPNVTFLDLALNLAGTPYGHSNQKMQQRIIGQGLNSVQIAKLVDMLDEFENTLNRKTW